MKRIPYGISNYSEIIKENYYYVDKTKYIEIIENLNEKYLIFLRPRRFGKSLFVSMLEYYYDKKYKEEFKELFGNYYIGKNTTKLQGSYYILTFTFSGINTDSKEGTERGFNGNVANAIESFLSKYNIDLDIDRNLSAAEICDYFFSKMKTILDGKMYILIDEYDHFANELLSFNYDFFKESVSKNRFVRKFYETIKEATRKGLVNRIFITGVSPITLDSMTSGFNIGSNITRESEFNEMMGFTEEEVIVLSKSTVGEKFDIHTNLEKLKNYYNGYLFNIKGKSKVYNSDMVLYYMSYYQRKDEEPEDLVDRNVVSDYSKIGNLFGIGGYDEKRMEILKGIVRGIEQDVRITERFNLEVVFSLDDFKSLLFFMGFMTIKRADEEEGKIFIDVPNYVIKELYFEYFRKLIEKETQYVIDNSDIRNAIAEISKYGTITQLVKLTEETLHRLSNRDFLKFDEKYIQVIMMTYLIESSLYYAKSEYEVEDGYIDIVLKKGTFGKPVNFAMIELKYLTKQDFSEEAVAGKIREAKEQLSKYAESEELRAIPNLKKWAVVFCNDKCVGVEELKM